MELAVGGMFPGWGLLGARIVAGWISMTFASKRVVRSRRDRWNHVLKTSLVWAALTGAGIAVPMLFGADASTTVPTGVLFGIILALEAVRDGKIEIDWKRELLWIEAASRWLRSAKRFLQARHPP